MVGGLSWLVGLSARAAVGNGAPLAPSGDCPGPSVDDRGSGGARLDATEASGIEVLRTAYRAPKENAVGERFLGSVRREGLDHVLVPDEAHLRRILREYVAYFNAARPHQGLQQQIPDRAEVCLLRPETGGTVRAIPVLGEFHHTYRRVA